VSLLAQAVGVSLDDRGSRDIVNETLDAVKERADPVPSDCIEHGGVFFE
jgi:hypothetical protein